MTAKLAKLALVACLASGVLRMDAASPLNSDTRHQAPGDGVSKPAVDWSSRTFWDPRISVALRSVQFGADGESTRVECDFLNGFDESIEVPAYALNFMIEGGVRFWRFGTDEVLYFEPVPGPCLAKSDKMVRLQPRQRHAISLTMPNRFLCDKTATEDATCANQASLPAGIYAVDLAYSIVVIRGGERRRYYVQSGNHIGLELGAREDATQEVNHSALQEVTNHATSERAVTSGVPAQRFPGTQGSAVCARFLTS